MISLEDFLIGEQLRVGKLKGRGNSFIIKSTNGHSAEKISLQKTELHTEPTWWKKTWGMDVVLYTDKDLSTRPATILTNEGEVLYHNVSLYGDEWCHPNSLPEILKELDAALRVGTIDKVMKKTQGIQKYKARLPNRKLIESENLGNIPLKEKDRIIVLGHAHLQGGYEVYSHKGEPILTKSLVQRYSE